MFPLLFVHIWWGRTRTRYRYPNGQGKSDPREAQTQLTVKPNTTAKSETTMQVWGEANDPTTSLFPSPAFQAKVRQCRLSLTYHALLLVQNRNTSTCRSTRTRNERHQNTPGKGVSTTVPCHLASNNRAKPSKPYYTTNDRNGSVPVDY